MSCAACEQRATGPEVPRYSGDCLHCLRALYRWLPTEQAAGITVALLEMHPASLEPFATAAAKLRAASGMPQREPEIPRRRSR